MIQLGGGIYGNIPDDYFDLIDHDNRVPTPMTSKYLQDLEKYDGSNTPSFG
jgi:hypothetical protein